MVENVDRDSTGGSNKNNSENASKNASVFFCKSSSSKPVVYLSQASKLLKSLRDTTP